MLQATGISDDTKLGMHNGTYTNMQRTDARTVVRNSLTTQSVFLCHTLDNGAD